VCPERRGGIQVPQKTPKDLTHDLNRELLALELLIAKGSAGKGSNRL
jgi:hypothetical protein